MSKADGQILNSKLSYRILAELSQKSRSPTEISEVLETSSQSVNNYLKLLSKADIVTKTEKEGRKQPYKLKKKSLIPVFDSIWTDKWEKSERKEELREIFEEFNKDEGSQEINQFLLDYSNQYFQRIETSTIQEMFGEKLYEDVVKLDQDERLKKELGGPYNWFEEFASFLKAIENRSIEPNIAVKTIEQKEGELE